ncbi:MAG: diaminopimelate decarboxylase, partial [Burkholderiales bacterium]
MTLLQLGKKINPNLAKGFKQALVKCATPFYLYVEEDIRNQVQHLLRAFAWNTGFKEFFAVKALPNPYILKLLREEGAGVDCSSMAELVLAEKCGFRGGEIIFTSNNTPVAEYAKALELGAIINLDDITHIDLLAQNLYLPELLCFRYNPGEFNFANSIIGNPREAKFGLTREQIFHAYAMAKERGVKRFGLHTMVASNELNPLCFVENAKLIFTLAQQIMQQVGIKFEFINLGGGLGIPYLPEEQPLDILFINDQIQQLFNQFFPAENTLSLAMENGRYITGP